MIDPEVSPVFYPSSFREYLSARGGLRSRVFVMLAVTGFCLVAGGLAPWIALTGWVAFFASHYRVYRIGYPKRDRLLATTFNEVVEGVDAVESPNAYVSNYAIHAEEGVYVMGKNGWERESDLSDALLSRLREAEKDRDAAAIAATMVDEMTASDWAEVLSREEAKDSTDLVDKGIGGVEELITTPTFKDAYKEVTTVTGDWERLRKDWESVIGDYENMLTFGRPVQYNPEPLFSYPVEVAKAPELELKLETPEEADARLGVTLMVDASTTECCECGNPYCAWHRITAWASAQDFADDDSEEEEEEFADDAIEHAFRYLARRSDERREERRAALQAAAKDGEVVLIDTDGDLKIHSYATPRGIDELEASVADSIEEQLEARRKAARASAKIMDDLEVSVDASIEASRLMREELGRRLREEEKMISLSGGPLQDQDELRIMIRKPSKAPELTGPRPRPAGAKTALYDPALDSFMAQRPEPGQPENGPVRTAMVAEVREYVESRKPTPIPPDELARLNTAFKESIALKPAPADVAKEALMKTMRASLGDVLASIEDEKPATQRDDVLAMLQDGQWWTLSGLAGESGFPETSVSARLRDLRKRQYGGHVIERKAMGDGSRRFMYRLVV